MKNQILTLGLCLMAGSIVHASPIYKTKMVPTWQCMTRSIADERVSVTLSEQQPKLPGSQSIFADLELFVGDKTEMYLVGSIDESGRNFKEGGVAGSYEFQIDEKSNRGRLYQLVNTKKGLTFQPVKKYGVLDCFQVPAETVVPEPVEPSTSMPIATVPTEAIPRWSCSSPSNVDVKQTVVISVLLGAKSPKQVQAYLQRYVGDKSVEVQFGKLSPKGFRFESQDKSVALIINRWTRVGTIERQMFIAENGTGKLSMIPDSEVGELSCSEVVQEPIGN